MKYLKLALLLCASTLAFNACTDASNTNNNETTRANTAQSPAATTSPLATPTPDEFAAARATYNSNCIRCHKENGEGGLVELDEKTKLKVPNFKEGHALQHTEEQFARKIANGDDGMPAFKKRLSQEQIDELARFVRRELQAGLVTAPPPQQK
ncbi:MAG TPA: cytochrome c [Pyrinomonadaceae bacterium]|nr:cytochrome c [Pyrinomonadaceae bacterium]